MTDSINIQDKPNLATPFIGTAHIVRGAGCMKRYGVRPSVCPIHLLPWAQWVGDTDRLLHGQHHSSKCGQCHVFSISR